MDGSELSTTAKAKITAALSLLVPDPYTVQLIGLKPASSGLICGKFNAKNSFGAYTGFRPFLLDTKSGLMTPLPDLRGFDIRQPNAQQELEKLEMSVNRIKAECPGY